MIVVSRFLAYSCYTRLLLIEPSVGNDNFMRSSYDPTGRTRRERGRTASLSDRRTGVRRCSGDKGLEYERSMGEFDAERENFITIPNYSSTRRPVPSTLLLPFAPHHRVQEERWEARLLVGRPVCSLVLCRSGNKRGEREGRQQEVSERCSSRKEIDKPLEQYRTALH